MIEFWLWLAVSEIIWLTALSTVIFADTDSLVDCNIVANLCYGETDAPLKVNVTIGNIRDC